MLTKGPYDPVREEPEILKYWLKNKFFKPEYHPKKGLQTFEQMKKDRRPPFCIINPPPNAYMRPHIGNVAGYAYQDVFLRFNRMLGKKVLGQPGKDHAGIQGEVVLEKMFIQNKGKSKHDLGREKFYLSSYDHFHKLMPKVMADEQRIGLSSDYDRNLFTLDPKIVETVLGTFIKMFRDKMVYKGVRIVNWDPVAQTTLADIDTERKERETDLVYIRYPLISQTAWLFSFIDQKLLLNVKMGTKSVETRALNPDEPERFFGNISRGDLIVCVDKAQGDRIDHVYKKASKVKQFKNVADAWEHVPAGDWKKVFDVPVNSLAGLRKIYANIFPGYLDRVEKNGVIWVELAELNADDYVTVATTRAETMLGDTAVVVNPKDQRFKKLVGAKLVLPIVNRIIPIITSPRVEKDFGTGAVKLTPAHSYDDFVMMTEWNEQNPDKTVGYVNIINKQAEMAGPVPQKYLGKTTEECRSAVLRDLGSLVIKSEKHLHSVMIGERSKAVIEQLMSSQWFVDVGKLKQPALDVVRSGEVKIHPSYMVKKYLQWLNNLRDWPVSRSLWWGYRIPVWYKGVVTEAIDKDGQIAETINSYEVFGINDAVEKGLARVQLESPGKGWIQDEDVFDTWFSSGQWPYATLKANDLMDTFFPTNIMETGYDILELWVSRMIMLSLYHEDKVPFTDVYLHGLVKAPDGQKMSKSKNNVIEPEGIINKYGADSLRLMYLVGNKAGAGYPVSYEKLEGHKRFLNKIWNASRFVLSYAHDVKPDKAEITDRTDKALLKKLDKLALKIRKHLEKFQVGLAADILYQEFWHDFCDIYLEAVKPRLYTKDKDGNPMNTSAAAKKSLHSAQATLLQALKSYLIMLHPFIPFITEKVWQELPKAKGETETVMYAEWRG
jgi:valyl-tRNA synthetase